MLQCNILYIGFNGVGIRTGHQKSGVVYAFSFSFSTTNKYFSGDPKDDPRMLFHSTTVYVSAGIQRMPTMVTWKRVGVC